MRTRRARRSLALVGLVVGAGLLLAPAMPVTAETNPLERGPAPTATSVVLPEGPLTYARVRITGSASIGFDRGTVYYPADPGTYAVVVAVPGLVWPESAVGWVGPYLASNGFVVMTIDPFSVLDGPTSRAEQLDAAVRWLTTASPHAVRSHIDPGRVGLVGQGFGGAAAIAAATRDSDAGLRATVDLGHTLLGPRSGDPVGVEAGMLSWLKRRLDEDVRYDPFVCPPGDDGIGSAPSSCLA